MKRILLSLFSVVIAVCLASCGLSNETDSSKEKFLEYMDKQGYVTIATEYLEHEYDGDTTSPQIVSKLSSTKEDSPTIEYYITEDWASAKYYAVTWAQEYELQDATIKNYSITKSDIDSTIDSNMLAGMPKHFHFSYKFKNKSSEAKDYGYVLICTKDNTILKTYCKFEEKDKAKEIFNALGYEM